MYTFCLSQLYKPYKPIKLDYNPHRVAELQKNEFILRITVNIINLCNNIRNI